MKKKFAALLAGAALMLGMVASAQALTLTLQSGPSTVVVGDNLAGDLSPTLNKIQFEGTVNGIDVSYTIGKSTFNPTKGTFDLGSLVVDGAGSISITLSDSGLVLNTLPISPNTFVTQKLSASSDTAEVTGDVKINGTSVPGIEATVIGTSGITTSGYATVGSNFSMDEIITINLGRTANTVSLDNLVTVKPVPEPGTMMLLGAGFLGLAIYGKRRKNG